MSLTKVRPQFIELSVHVNCEATNTYVYTCVLTNCIVAYVKRRGVIWNPQLGPISSRTANDLKPLTLYKRNLGGNLPSNFMATSFEICLCEMPNIYLVG